MFGSDGSPIVQYVVIFAVIFTALAAIVFVVRRLTGRGLALPGRAGGRGRQPRLGIVDVYELDRARQLILLRRDNVEHLLLVGGPNDVVIERNIQRGQRPLPEATLRPEPVAGPLAEPLPDPLAGAGRLPEPPLALPEIAARRPEILREPAFEMPVVVRPPVPGSGAVPPVTLPLDAGLLGGDEPGQDILSQDIPGQDIPVPARAANARPSPAPPPPASTPPAPAREPFSARRLLRRAASPILEPRSEPASERRQGGARTREATVRVGPEPAQGGTTTAPPLAVPAERRAVDPAVLSDMARQLQEALARPSSAVTPAPAVAPPAPLAPPAKAVEPVAAAMSAAVPEPEPTVTPPPEAPEPPAAPTAPEPTAPEPAEPAPAPLEEHPARPAHSPEAAPPPPPEDVPSPPAEAHPPPPAPPPAPEPARSAANPFSVEEIEAEFARLLGRPLDKRG